MYSNQIRKIRLEKGISLTELAYKSGISVRLFMSFRKRQKKKSVCKYNGTNSNFTRKKRIRNIF